MCGVALQGAYLLTCCPMPEMQGAGIACRRPLLPDVSSPGAGSVIRSDGRIRAGALIRACLDDIGWPLRQAARRSGFSRNRVGEFAAGEPVNPEFVEWLCALRAVHKRFPSPLARSIVVAGNRPPYRRHEVFRAITIIGWSFRFLAQGMGEHRTALLRHLDRGGALEPRSSRWLEQLETGHETYPRPEYRNCAMRTGGFSDV